MDKKSEQKLKRKLQSLKSQMATIGPVMRGSVVKLGTTCGNPKCRCAKGDKHMQFFFSLTKNKKTKIMFLGNTRVVKAKQCVKNYRRLLKIIDEMTFINMELLKAKVA